MAIAETCPSCGFTDRQTPERTRCSDPWHADAHLRRKALGQFDFVKEDGSIHRSNSPLTIDKAALARREEIAQLGRPRERAIDEKATAIRLRAETSRRHFEGALTMFVRNYAPKDLHDRDDFQRDLMMLMRDAMQHQGNVYGMHIERTEATIHNLVNTASAPLQAIFDPPKKDG